MSVTTYSGVMHVEASCECGWESTAANAMPNAKRHAATTGHVVICQQIVGVTYAPTGLTKDEVWERRRYPDMPVSR